MNSDELFLKFLSCLRGSEALKLPNDKTSIFLSCLRGSEVVISHKQELRLFLSCLRGSEVSCRN